MEDQSSYSQKKTPFHDQELLKCPRCDSSNTKFCYYNNYNLSQPRHFCKNCRRYWTKGGTLRNIPVGGSSRKNTKRISSNTKRASSLSSISDYPKQEHSSSASSLLYYNHLTVPGYVNDPRFGSHFDANGQFGSTLEGPNPTGGLQFAENQINSGTGFGLNSAAAGDGFESSKINSEVGFMEVQNGGDSSCWSATTSNGWPNLAIYTPGPNF